MEHRACVISHGWQGANYQPLTNSQLAVARWRQDRQQGYTAYSRWNQRHHKWLTNLLAGWLAGWLTAFCSGSVALDLDLGLGLGVLSKHASLARHMALAPGTSLYVTWDGPVLKKNKNKKNKKSAVQHSRCYHMTITWLSLDPLEFENPEFEMRRNGDSKFQPRTSQSHAPLLKCHDLPQQPTALPGRRV